jgi:hypothetical protein
VTSYNVSSKRSDLSKGKLTVSKQNELQEAFIRASAARKTFDHLAPNCSTVKNSVVLAHLIEKVSGLYTNLTVVPTSVQSAAVYVAIPCS